MILDIGDRIEHRRIFGDSTEEFQSGRTGTIIQPNLEGYIVQLDVPRICVGKVNIAPGFMVELLNGEYATIIRFIKLEPWQIRRFRRNVTIAEIPNDFAALKTLSENFKRQLVSLWDNIVFRRVKFISAKISDITHYTKFDITLENTLDCITVSSIDVSHSEFDNKWMVCHYSHYRGLTTKNGVRKDMYHGQEIRFTSDTFSELDFSDNMELSFMGGINDGGSVLPHAYQIICGTVTTDCYGEPNFSKWFRCSEQFLRLWTLVMCGTSHTSFEGLSLNDICKTLNTHRNKMWLCDKQVDYHVKKKAFKIKNILTEDRNYQFPNIYRMVAKIAFGSPLYTIDVPSAEYLYTLLRAVLF